MYEMPVAGRISKAILIETARYDDIYLRPYHTRFDQTVAQELIDSTEGGTSFSSAALSTAAGSFLQPASTANRVAPLEHGFAERRFSFMMELVREASGLSGRVRYLLTGYTDELGYSNLHGNMNLNPQMKIYFNNIFSLRDTPVPTAHGVATETNVIKNKHILYNTAGNAAESYMAPQLPLWSLRPEDVMTTVEREQNPMMAGFTSTGVEDYRTMISAPRMSDRQFESRPNYLHQTISSFKAAQAKSDEYESGEGNVWSVARDYLREGSMSSDPVMALLMQNHNYRSFGYITLQELDSMMPGLYDVADVVLAGAAQQAQQYQPGNAESWKGSNYETIAATLISHAVPSIMADSILTTVQFLATNNVMGGKPDVKVVEANGFAEGIDYAPYINHLIERLKREVLWDISHQNQIAFNIQCRFDLMNESIIHISLDGGAMTPYVVPSFCDGLFSPVVGDTQDVVHHMAADVGNMLNIISDMSYAHHGGGGYSHGGSGGGIPDTSL